MCRNIRDKISGKTKGLIEFIQHRIFYFSEKYLKFHILPVSFYSPIPDTSKLNPRIFEKIYDCVGLDWDENNQLKYLSLIHSRYYDEYTPSPNSGLSLVDAFILYAMVREVKPKIMIEVGAGESTKIALQAIKVNNKEGCACKLFSVDPYMPLYLKKLKDMNLVLIPSKLEDVDIDFLISADLLFIDSSHVSKIGSDVNYEILEVIPKLKKDTVIHWHDIMIPTDYYKEWCMKNRMFWNESYMVYTFMLFNDSYKIMWASRYMQLNHGEALKSNFAYFDSLKHRCSSFWVRKIN